MPKRRFSQPMVNEAVWPIMFGSEETREQFDALCRTARAEQTTRFHVAPKSRIRTRRGLVGPGTAIRRADLVGREDLHELIKFDRVLERPDLPEAEAQEVTDDSEEPEPEPEPEAA